VTRLPVGSSGIVDPESVRAAITDATILISVMTANNEIGTIQPIREIGKIARDHGVPFHTDAAQAVGRLPLDVEADHIDLLSVSSHKIYGPKGIGALYVRRRNPRIQLQPQIHGGGHEHTLRSGTLPVPLIVGFGEALRLAREEMPAETLRVASLRDRLMIRILQSLDDVTINGAMTPRLSNNLNLSFAHAESEAILVNMGDVALSSGSACSSATETSSHVLDALGVPPDRARSAIRFGLGRFNTVEEVDYVVSRIVETVTQLRARSPHRRLGAAKPEGKASLELH
jgi:cysteine desulfurase